MSDLRLYIENRKNRDPEFAENYDKGYQEFKLGVMLRQAREGAGLTQEELAKRINTKKTAISRIENHAEDIKLSTLEKFASALGKQLTISVSWDIFATYKEIRSLDVSNNLFPRRGALILKWTDPAFFQKDLRGFETSEVW